jgi:hypothetical protein
MHAADMIKLIPDKPDYRVLNQGPKWRKNEGQIRP